MSGFDASDGHPRPRRSDGLAIRAAFGMLLSASVYLICGFMLNWTHERLVTGELVPMVTTLKWTLRGGGVLFAFCGIAAFLGIRAAVPVYAVISIGVALIIAAVAVWDWTTPNLFSGIHPAILAIIAVFTIYTGLDDLLSNRS